MFHMIFLLILSLILLYLLLLKETKKIVIYLIIGMSFVCWIPHAINYFFVSSYFNNIEIRKETVEFWSNYLGNIIGTLISLYGIWQENIRKERKKENSNKINLLTALNYDLEINLKDENYEKKKYNLLSVLDFTSISFLYENRIEAIHSFKSIDFKNSMTEILNLKYGKRILNINLNIESFNKAWLFLIKNSKERKRIIEKIKQSNNQNLVKLIEIIEILSEMIFCYTSYNFSNFHKQKMNMLKKQIDGYKNYLKKHIKLTSLLENKEKYDFSVQNNKGMEYILELLKENIQILHYFPYEKEIISLEEEDQLSRHCNAVYTIVSINIFKLFEEMEDINEKILEDKNKLC